MQHCKYKVGDRVRVTLPDWNISGCVYIGNVVGFEEVEHSKEPAYLVLTDGRKLLRRVLQSWIEPI